jgi:hypothetical protein
LPPFFIAGFVPAFLLSCFARASGIGMTVLRMVLVFRSSR